ncbi:hypothetical protein [Sinomonas sp. G460-2]|uniref:hypothetical protein n=1 Tax=Sinomonas sp. G460-2 TaxID=3393464 RepID=UPI0039EDE99A
MAQRDGVVHFTGLVDEIMPEFRLFWAVSRFGERRIIDLGEYEVYMKADAVSQRSPEAPVLHKPEEEAAE